MRIENTKRTSEVCKNSLALQSLKNVDVVVIRIVSTSLGFVQSFFMRGHNATKPEASQFS